MLLKVLFVCVSTDIVTTAMGIITWDPKTEYPVKWGYLINYMYTNMKKKLSDRYSNSGKKILYQIIIKKNPDS